MLLPILSACVTPPFMYIELPLHYEPFTQHLLPSDKGSQWYIAQILNKILVVSLLFPFQTKQNSFLVFPLCRVSHTLPFRDLWLRVFWHSMMYSTHLSTCFPAVPSVSGNSLSSLTRSWLTRLLFRFSLYSVYSYFSQFVLSLVHTDRRVVPWSSTAGREFAIDEMDTVGRREKMVRLLERITWSSRFKARSVSMDVMFIPQFYRRFIVDVIGFYK